MRNALHGALLSSAILVALASVAPGVAGAQTAADELRDLPSPPDPSAAAIDQNGIALANPIDSPITGAALAPAVADVERPPSLEALQATRPGYSPDKTVSSARASALRQAALSYGARGGLAARNFALNEMLRRYEPKLDVTFDFRSLVLPVGGGRTLLRPPVITEAQMASALSDTGQTARETGTIYQITRQASLTYAPPNWRSYLVRTVVSPTPPSDDMRPRTTEEVGIWQQTLADGWADGERQAVEIFLDDLGRLQRDLVGMARYRVLLRAGVVETPEIAFASRAIQGGHDMMRVDDTEIRIKNQPGLNPDRNQWKGEDTPGPMRIIP